MNWLPTVSLFDDLSALASRRPLGPECAFQDMAEGIAATSAGDATVVRAVSRDVSRGLARYAAAVSSRYEQLIALVPVRTGLAKRACRSARRDSSVGVAPREWLGSPVGSWELLNKGDVTWVFGQRGRVG